MPQVWGAAPSSEPTSEASLRAELENNDFDDRLPDGDGDGDAAWTPALRFVTRLCKITLISDSVRSFSNFPISPSISLRT